MDADFSTFNSFLNAGTNQNVFAKFFDKYVKTGKIQENGLPEYVKKQYIQIQVRDSHDVVNRPADYEDYQRFPKEYEFYKLKLEKEKSGTPLQMFAFLNAAQIDCCNVRGIFTVEDLSKLTKEQALSINLIDEVELAKNFLKASKNNAVISELRENEKKLKAEISKLKDELEALKNEHTTNSTRGG